MKMNTDIHITESKKCEKSTFCYNTEIGRCQDSEDSEKSLNRMGNEKCETLLPYGQKERYTEMNTDNKRIASEKYEKLIIRYSTVTGSPQEMKVTPYGKGDYRLSGGKSSEE